MEKEVFRVVATLNAKKGVIFDVEKHEILAENEEVIVLKNKYFDKIFKNKNNDEAIDEVKHGVIYGIDNETSFVGYFYGYEHGEEVLRSYINNYLNDKLEYYKKLINLHNNQK